MVSSHLVAFCHSQYTPAMWFLDIYRALLSSCSGDKSTASPQAPQPHHSRRTPSTDFPACVSLTIPSPTAGSHISDRLLPAIVSEITSMTSLQHPPWKPNCFPLLPMAVWLCLELCRCLRV